MLIKKVVIISLLIIIPFVSIAHEIHLKNGRVIEVDSYWDRDGEIIYEQYGTTIYLDKKKIKEIKTEDENQFAQKQATKNKKIKELEKKYNTIGAVIFLKSGKTIIAKKTWFEDGLIYCKTDKQVLHLTIDQISQFGRASKAGKEKGRNSNFYNSRKNELVWKRHKRIDETTAFCLKGDCQNGYGHAQWRFPPFENDYIQLRYKADAYYGYWKNGRIHGQGHYRSPSNYKGTINGIWENGVLIENLFRPRKGNSIFNENKENYRIWNFALELEGRLPLFEMGAHDRNLKYVANKAIEQHPEDYKLYLMRAQINLLIIRGGKPTLMRLSRNASENKLKMVSLRQVESDLYLYLPYYPDDSEGYWIKAIYHMVLKEYSEALKNCIEVISLNPDNEYALFLAGELSFWHEEFDDAIHYYSKYLEINPESSIGYYRRAFVWECKNDRRTMLEDFKKAQNYSADYDYQATPTKDEFSELYFLIKTPKWVPLIKKNDITYNSKTNTPYNGEVFATYSENDKLLQAKFNGGKLNGNYIFFNRSSSQPNIKLNFLDGILNGPITINDTRDSNLLKAGFKNGHLDGNFNTFLGKKKKISLNFKKGLLDGKALSWDKKIEKTKAYYKNGLLHNKYFYFHDNGEKGIEGVFKNNIRKGKWVFKDFDGNHNLTIKYKHDRVDKIKFYDKKHDRWINLEETIHMDKDFYWLEKGREYLQSGDRWNALIAFLIAYEIRPQSAEICIFLGSVFKSLGMLDLAIWCFKHSINNSDDDPAFDELLNVYKEIGQFQEFDNIAKYTNYDSRLTNFRIRRDIKTDWDKMADELNYKFVNNNKITKLIFPYLDIVFLIPTEQDYLSNYFSDSCGPDELSWIAPWKENKKLELSR